MSRYPFQIVDVFCEGAFSGNPLAVVVIPADIDTLEMQRITRWLNLSETAFLLPADNDSADYRVRIFTLDRELPFAGHPTLGTCHAWLHGGGTPRLGDTITQHCGAGLVQLRRSAGGLAFAAPPIIRAGPVDGEKCREIAEILGIAVTDIVDARWVDNGPGWVAVRLASAEAVLALTPARSHSTRIDLGVVGLYPPGAPCAYEVRAFFSDPAGSLIEDPVTGSLNAPVAEWLINDGLATPPYRAAQGTRLGRQGRIDVTQDAGGKIWIGGKTVTRVEGAITI